MSEAKIRELIKRRGNLKTKLTLFNKFLAPLSSQNTVSHVEIKELQSRLNKFDSLISEFDALQSELEMLVDEPAGQTEQREQFENEYYKLTALAQETIEKHRRIVSFMDAMSEVGSGCGTEASHKQNNNVRLPKIDLPHFDGNYKSWLEYRDTFTSLIHENGSIDEINKFHYLRASLKGSAALIIKSLDFSANNYKEAWKLLFDRFNNKRLLVNNHVQALFNAESIRKESSQALRHLIDITNKNLRALATLDQPTDHWDTLIIYMVSSKLDSVTNREWEEHRNNLKEPPTFSDFISFLSNRADLLETLEESKSASLGNRESKSFIVSTSGKKDAFPPLCCPICTKEHFLFGCQTFRDLPVESRIAKAHNAKVCMNCLRPGHSTSKCKLSHCKYCKSRHNTLLHSEPEVVKTENMVALNCQSQTQTRHVILSTALVKVLDVKGKPHVARLLLDNGSTANFVTQALCGKLNIRTHTTNSKVSGINSMEFSSAQSCSLKIESCNGEYSMNIDCFVLPQITSSLPTSYIDINDLSIPSNIVLADPTFNEPSSIDILVGADIFWAVIGSSRIQLGKHMPTLYETKLGWLISGAVWGKNQTSSVCMFTQGSEANTDLTRFWELDTISPKHHFTSEENACEKHFIETTKRDSDGRFVVSIPLKEDVETLGDSFKMAQKRFFSLERKLERESHFKELYISFMREYISLGHMTPTNNQSDATQIQHFLPHHGVLRESSATTKLRTVFDASAVTTSGKSFNEIQMVGPTVQDDLLSILLRFRQHKYVVTGDVEKMYRQILVTDSQRSLQQILWREDPSNHLQSYKLNTITYGLSSSPFLATRCLTQLASETSHKDVEFAIAHDFYVDDLLTGADSIEQTVHLCNGIINTLHTAKFSLRKFQSNESQVLKAICKNSSSSDFVDLSTNEMSKTLGLNWQCSADKLSFSINFDFQEKVSKRHVLSVIAQVFDPLGLVTPCIVEAKIIMQQLWVNQCSWDEDLPQHIKTLWLKFAETLPLLNNISIPRWITCDSPCLVELHVFSDASEKAYGACVYVRSTTPTGLVVVRLLASKSKVAPIKPTTMPRLELCAALLGARLCAKISSSLTLHIDECVFWCDSMIVLGWLASSPTQLKPFVRHRVCEIQEGYSNNSWRYVPSKENPADLVSRGLSAELIGESSLWWTGPTFLKLSKLEWPVEPNSTLNSHLPEMVHQTFHTISATDTDLLSPLFDLYSNYWRLQRIVALIFRFVNRCRKVNTSKHTFLTTSELAHATNFLLHAAQQQSFSSEYELLSTGKPLPSKNRLLSLSPFIDSNNLIRVGGRLGNSYYDYNVQHPILLCSKHTLCKLIFAKYHKKLFHAGPQLLLASVRHNYWALGGRALARKTVHSCIKCCRFKADTVQPLMGNLPSQRVQLEFPFFETGIDYTGPVMIADRKGRGCRLVKAYISIFVCLATKAVHLELVSDMTKDAFIAALNRFIARRGKPQCIFSDNGTTFVGAFNELAHFLKQADLSVSDMIEQGINFSFIPCYTPHFGGMWESNIKSAKHHLRRVLGLTHLTFEEMSTCLAQVEAILNSRPITPLSSDPSDLTSLTPAHFLIGRSLLFVPHPDVSQEKITSLSRFRRIDHLKQHFWSRFSSEYILWLQQRTKWSQQKGELKEGTMVVVKDKSLPPLMWLLGRIIRLLPGKDNIARVADIRTKKGIIRRAFNNICPLPVEHLEDTSTRAV